MLGPFSPSTHPLTPELPIPRSRLLSVLAFCVLAVSACSAVGWELPNYGFFGFVPKPDPRQLAPVTVIENVKLVTATDTTDVHEGEFRIDTSRVGGERIWIITRRSLDAQQRPVLDSAWLDGWTLRTLNTASHRATGTLRQRFDRRAVFSELTGTDGRTKRRKTLYEAEPYGTVGIEVIISALPLQDGAGGQLPVVDGFGGDLAWLTYEVLTKIQEPRSAVGGIVIRPVWLVEVGLRGEKQRLWIDGMDRSILRRESVISPTTKHLVVRGQPVPSLQFFPVEPLASSTPATRSLRQGSPAQVVPWQPPPPTPATPPPAEPPPSGGVP